MNQWISQIMKFGLTSMVGLAADFVIYWILIQAQIVAAYANFLSSGVAVSIVYFMSKNYVFERNKQNIFRVIVFFTYYAISIAAFSILIQTIIDLEKTNPIFAKLLVIPISFITNFIFSKVILERMGSK